MLGKDHALVLAGTPESFWSRVERRGPDDCWPYRGDRTRRGYGVVCLAQVDGRRRRTQAHRVSFWLETGVDPGNLSVLHHCDNPPCCNPNHLFLGDHRDNGRDMASKGRGKGWPRTVAAEQAKQIKTLWVNGFDSKKISAQVGVSPKHILRIVAGRSIHGAGSKAPYQRHGLTRRQSKITDAQAAEIRARYAAGGITQRQLAK